MTLETQTQSQQPLELLQGAVEATLPPFEQPEEGKWPRGLDIDPAASTVTPESLNLSSVSSTGAKHNIAAVIPAADGKTGLAILRVVAPSGDTQFGVGKLVADETGALKFTNQGQRIKRGGIGMITGEPGAFGDTGTKIAIGVKENGQEIRVSNMNPDQDMTVVTQLPSPTGRSTEVPKADINAEPIQPPKLSKEAILQNADSLRAALLSDDKEVGAAARALLAKEKSDAVHEAWDALIAPNLEAWKKDPKLVQAHTKLDEVSMFFGHTMPQFEGALEGLGASYGEGASGQATHNANLGAQEVYATLGRLFPEAENQQELIVALRTVGSALNVEAIAEDPRVRAAVKDERLRDALNTADWRRNSPQAAEDDALLERIAAGLRMREGDLSSVTAQLVGETRSSYTEQALLEKIQKVAAVLSERNLALQSQGLESELDGSYASLLSQTRAIAQGQRGFDYQVTSRLFDAAQKMKGVGVTVLETRSLLDSLNR